MFPCPVNMWANIIRYTTKAKYSNAVQKRSILHLQDKIFPNSCFVSLHGRFFTKFLYRVSLLRKFIMWLAFTNVLMFVKPNLQQQTVYRAYRPTYYRAAYLDQSSVKRSLKYSAVRILLHSAVFLPWHFFLESHIVIIGSHLSVLQ